MFWKGYRELKARGGWAAAFIGATVANLLIGVLAYLRRGLPWLEVYPPAGRYSGIWLYSYIVWIVVWLIAYAALRRRAQVGSLFSWMASYVLSLIVGLALVLLSLKLGTLLVP